MARKHSDNFKREAVRIATHSGLARRQVASDLGTGLSTLGKCKNASSKVSHASGVILSLRAA